MAIEYVGDDFGFEVDFKVVEPDWIEGEVQEITARSGENNEIAERAHYLKFTIKWDGCSHLRFRDDGYLHFCGGWDYRKHVELLEFLYRRAFELMGQERPEPDVFPGAQRPEGASPEGS